MKYYEVNEEQMLSILLNLNKLEEEFCQGDWDHPMFGDTSIYTDYLQNQFIWNHRIEQIYYPSLPTDIKPKTTQGMFELEEVYMILSNVNISICKQFNFHFGRQHQINCFEMVWVLKGGADFYLGSDKIMLKDGDMLVHPPGIPYEFRMHEGAVGISFVIRNRYIQESYVKLFAGNSFALHFFKKATKREEDINYLLFHAQEGKDKINSLVLQMFIEYLWGEKYQSEIMNRYFETIVYQVRKVADYQVEVPKKTNLMEEYFNRIRFYIKEHYRTATLENAASELNFSQQYIARILRKTSGKSFHQFVEEERIAKVKEYLAETDYNLEIIAELTGYSSGSYLSKAFHKIEECTVSAYREKCK